MSYDIWVDKKEYFNDKDVSIIYNYFGDTIFSICKTRYSEDFLVQITPLCLHFNVNSVKMGYDIVKKILNVKSIGVDL